MNFNKFNLFLSAALLATLPAYAQESNDTAKSEWRANFRRVALDISSTSVGNAEEYKDSPNSKLSADGEEVVKGVFDFMLEHETIDSRWDNGVYAEYGKTKLKPAEGEDSKSENADKILVSSDYTLRLWSVQDFLGGFEAGPFVSVAYETEFNATGNNRIKKVVRGSAGAKLFEGKYLKSLFAAGFMEYDFTYPEHAVNYGYEAGLNLEYLVREGVTAKFMALFRDYCYTTKKLYTDLDYSLELDARMDVLVLKNLAVAPFINYYTAQGKYVGPRGENLYIGVSFSFSHTFMAAK